MFEVNAIAIRALMSKHGWTITALSQATHLHDKTCRKLVNGGKVNLKVLATAAQIFGVDMEELILKEVVA